MSILDGEATLHKNVEVKFAVIDLIKGEDVVVTSDTHGNNEYLEDGEIVDNHVLEDLVLISNPDENNPREIEGFAGFDFYSTAIIDFKREVDGEIENISDANKKFKELFNKDLYDVEISTNIKALTLQAIEFGRIRAIATSTCFGSGEIVVKFIPNDCVGDVKEFSVTIPCTVGERATGFKVENDGQPVEINKVSEYDFSCTTPLKDSSSLGQAFKFEVLGTNTLSALDKYVVKIDKKLLYIEPLPVQPSDWEENWTSYYVYGENGYEKISGDSAPDFVSGKYYTNKNFVKGIEKIDLSGIKRYANLISILKDGRQVTFHEDGNNYVSEPFTASQTLYIKWVKTIGDTLSESDYFGIEVCNYYDERYDIKNNGFENTIINCTIAFNRQRTVESLSYVPVMVDTTSGIQVSGPNENEIKNGWQFYFKQDMLSNNTGAGIYYGFEITNVTGIGGTTLTEAELEDINVNIKITPNDSNMRFGLLNPYNYVIDYCVSGNYIFNFDSGNTGYENIIIIGSNEDLAKCGDYTITMTQGKNTISSRNIKVYMELTEDDVTLNVGNAEFSGDLLQYKYIPMYERPSGWNNLGSDEYYKNYYEFSGGEYIPASDIWSKGKAYYKSIAEGDETNKYFTLSNNDLMYLNDTYILQTRNESNANGYDVNISIKDEGFRNISGQTVKTSLTTYSGASLTSLIVTTSANGDKIYTTSVGSFNTQTKQQNYIKLTYTISTYTYTYYKQNTDESKSVDKVIYLYIYEPVTLATFDSTMIYKYDYDSITNEQFKEENGKHTLTLDVNNNSSTILNYTNIKWDYTEDGISEFNLNEVDSATFKFVTSGEIVSGRIVATIIQFGVQYPPIVCIYNVKKPILTDKIELNTKINNFASGGGFVNLKVGEEIQIEATAKSNKLDEYGNNLPVSSPGFNYIICSTTGYSINNVAKVNENGVLTAISAGRAKLIIVPKDRFTPQSSVITNYFNTQSYIENNEYIMIDIIVSDGSKNNPFLIASANDFRKIADDYYYIETEGGQQVKKNANGDTTRTNDYHYALVGNIDLNGQPITFNNFSGTLYSYQENTNLNNRFTIYGVMLDENSPNLFTTLNTNDDDIASFKDIEFHVNINYVATSSNRDINIGLIGTNNAKIENVTIMVSGNINANNLTNNYTIGSMVAINTSAGAIDITNPILSGVQGIITVINSSSSTIVLGGIVGKNEGSIQGSNITSSIPNGGEDVEYEVYYDNQGVTADVNLQVTGVGNADDSAVGGVVGFNNNGKINNVYSIGTILGVDQVKNLTVSNIGGLIGKNNGSSFNIKLETISDRPINDNTALNELQFANTEDKYFQIVNSYSSAVVKGLNNVGGVVGYDNEGAYKKTYYEMYANQQNVTGNNNVGGLIGYAYDSNLYYCYTNNFALGYVSSVETYNVVGKNNVGGLIGGAKSKRTSYGKDVDGALNIVNSLASVSLNGVQNVSGIVGRLEGFGAIYTAYFYGVINHNNAGAITQMYNGNNLDASIPYNNVYSIVNGVEIIGIEDETFYQGTGFGVNAQYNNGKPYIIYNNQGNLVSIIPTKVEINKAFETVSQGGYYNPEYNKMYKENNKGDYVLVYNDDTHEYKYEKYNPSTHTDATITRYSLMAEVIDTGDTSGNNSDYCAKALVLYYYQFTDMTGENALQDLYYLNTINMHNIVSDQGIIVLPNTLKRFNLRTSDSNIISVLTGGKLLLNNEGQATITLISTLNPSISASFVVIVRTKVLDFNLYSNANLRDEYNVSNGDNPPISIVKNSSKIIYADYSSMIECYGREYAYKPATNMQLQFNITYNGALPEGKTVRDYIVLNGIYDGNNEVYTIPYGTPITITVLDYINGSFKITANPLVVATYKNGAYSNEKVLPLTSYFERSFNVVTKQGASAINTNKTQLNMMPADEASNLDVKITTDIKVENLYFEVEAGDNWETANPYNPTNETILFVEMLDVYYNGNIIKQNYSTNNDGKKVLAKGTIDISNSLLNEEINIQQLDMLVLKLNEKSHYVAEAFTLEVIFYVLGANGARIATTLHINVKPQEISSVIALNYRMQENTEGNNGVSIDNAYQSQIIRPGDTNIITIDVAPNIAVFDYINIVDLTTEDKILLQQVDENLDLPEYMDTWTDDGIKLVKYDSVNKYNSLQSKLYVLARLPKLATANISHTLMISAYRNGNSNALYTTYLNLEAVMYPTVIMTYTDPNGKVIAEANTGDNTITHEVSDKADLAVGVEAEIDVVTHNIDQGSLKSSITITSGDNGENDYTADYINMVSLQYQYGKYFLQFNVDMESGWEYLVGKQINVTFTASKTLNKITETCKATISFTIRRMVIHSISMTNTNTSDKIHGNWNEEFTTQFYFDRTDISYYYRGYWNVQYTLENTKPTNYEDKPRIYDDMTAINNILEGLNSWSKDDTIKLYLLDLTATGLDAKFQLTQSYDKDDISIKNQNNKFVFKALTDSNINNMQLLVDFMVDYDNNRPKFMLDGDKISNGFGFDVTVPTNPFEDYILIYNQDDFEAMAEGEFYQLANDITLTNYTPLNVAIGGLNGNGKTIKFIKSIDEETNEPKDEFNIAQLVLDYTSGAMNIGLFGTLATDSIIQNLRIDYGSNNNGVTINLDSYTTIQEQHTNNIYFGGIAGINLGVITNVEVVGAFRLVAQYIGADHINLGGITASNGENSSTKVATITGSTVDLDIISIASIGGIAVTNYGKITNTNFKGSIGSNNNDINQYVAEVTTAGFVVDNMAGGYISLSNVDCENPGINTSSFDIYSVGKTAGFVLNNAGTINNCYIIRTRISSQGNIGGFAYQSPGSISNSYAYSQLGNSLFYNEFIYVTESADNISNCYVVTDNAININIRGLKPISIKNSQFINQEMYEGFIFATSQDGIWSISNNGPYQPNAGFKQKFDTFNIYDLTTFNGYFEMASVNNVITNGTFRLVRDIDFASEGWLDNPITFNKTLQSSFEGNDMVLSNYNIYKAGEVDSIGLFANIETVDLGIYVRNLILQPESIKASNSAAVGALAGTIVGARLYNITINNSTLMILGKNAVGGLAGIIKGSFEVIGITSNISVFATYNYNISKQYNLYMGKNILGETFIDDKGQISYVDNINNVSYAGSIAGIVDGYDNTSLKNKRSIYSYYTLTDLLIEGDLKFIGETVGGAFGLVGESTLVNNLNYNLTSDTIYQGVYVSGGLVGENRGIIRNSNIYAYTDTNGGNQDVDTSSCFNNFARVNGGIVGINIGGLIDSCVSDIYICTTEISATAGGVVGRNIGGSIYDCTISGKADAFFVGGVAGSDYTYTTMATQNSGEGTVTRDTKQVYTTILEQSSGENVVKYNADCFVNTQGDTENKLYSNNIFTDKFINNFIAQKSKYYSFNRDYKDEESSRLLNASSVLGLVIGLTDIGLNKKYYKADVSYDYPLTISLTIDNSTESRPKYQLAEDDTRTISPMAIRQRRLNSYDVYDISFISIIAHSNSGYELWSSTLGYGKDYIVISADPSKLIEVTEQTE